MLVKYLVNNTFVSNNNINYCYVFIIIYVNMERECNSRSGYNSITPTPL